MAARKRNWTPDIVRERIRTSMIVNRLTKHVLGKVEMKPSQVTAALGLLKKSIPDLSAIQHSGEITQRHVSELSDAELAHIAAGRSLGAADEATGPAQPTSLQ